MAKDLRRKLTANSFAVLALVTTISAYFYLDEIVGMLLNLMLRFSVTGFRILLWMIAVEAFPTTLSSTGVGFVHAIGDGGGSIGSFLTYLLFPISAMSVVSLFVGMAGVMLIASLFIDVSFLTIQGV